MLESNLCLESPRRPLMWYTFELGLKPSLVPQWSLCHYVYDIYMWKNTQLGPLFICFKRGEPHKSSGRAECSQKVVDVWIASRVSSTGFHPHGWQQRSPSCVAKGALLVLMSPATCAGQQCASGSAENRVPKRLHFHACQTPQFFLNSYSVCLLPVWTKPSAGKASQQSKGFCHRSLFQVYPSFSRSTEAEVFSLPHSAFGHCKTLFL